MPFVECREGVVEAVSAACYKWRLVRSKGALMVFVKVAFVGCCVAFASFLHSQLPEISMLAAGVLSFTVMAVLFGIGHKICSVILRTKPPEPVPSPSDRHQFPNWFDAP